MPQYEYTLDMTRSIGYLARGIRMGGHRTATLLWSGTMLVGIFCVGIYLLGVGRCGQCWNALMSLWDGERPEELSHTQVAFRPSGSALQAVVVDPDYALPPLIVSDPLVAGLQARHVEIDRLLAMSSTLTLSESPAVVPTP